MCQQNLVSDYQCHLIAEMMVRKLVLIVYLKRVFIVGHLLVVGR